MLRQRRRFAPFQPPGPLFDVGDLVVLLALAVALYLGVQAAMGAPLVLPGPEIHLEARALPGYALLSAGRMLAAYLLSLLFSILYAYPAARRRRAEQVLVPLLDVLQSIPILSFLPVVLLGFSAFLPQRWAAELSAIVLIFTCQTWNLTFSFYQSLKTLPEDLGEAAQVFQLSTWLRFRTLELPFAARGLIWNSMMAWAGGWFFLMAAEAYTVEGHNFRLPGLGSYLQAASEAGDTQALLIGIACLLGLIVLLDQLVWRPLLAWGERFQLEMVESQEPTTSWFYNLLTRSRILEGLRRRVLTPLLDRLDLFLSRPGRTSPDRGHLSPGRLGAVRWPGYAGLALLATALFYGLWQMGGELVTLPLATWGRLGLGVLASFLRVTVAIALAAVWTVPLGILIGTRPRVAAVLQPLVQILASVPATALFPIFLLLLLRVPAGIELAALLLMMTGTQWYLLFNVIAGASAIPQDLDFSTRLLGVRGWARWRTLLLPGIFPYLVTGLITASGGAWNASIVAEYTQFGGQTHSVVGLGSLIAQATAQGNYPLLLAATLLMIITVVLVNRLFWRRLYRRAEEQYRLE
jgi:NitT/TauT family transport system permease protein